MEGANPPTLNEYLRNGGDTTSNHTMTLLGHRQPPLKLSTCTKRPRPDAKAETILLATRIQKRFAGRTQSVNSVLLNCNDTLNVQRFDQWYGTKGRFRQPPSHRPAPMTAFTSDILRNNKTQDAIWAFAKKHENTTAPSTYLNLSLDNSARTQAKGSTTTHRVWRP